MTADRPLAQRAGILCNDPQFRRFAGRRLLGEPVEVSALVAADWVRDQCGVASRRELDADPDAARRWAELLTEFDAYRGRIARPEAGRHG